MAGRRELGFVKIDAGNMKEKVARTALRNLKLRGHTYVDLRKDGKREVFFCILCFARCYGESMLYKHFEGSLHRESLAAAKATLLKPNPWPFNDGVFFFTDMSEQYRSLSVSNSRRILLDVDPNDENSHAIISYGDNLVSDGNEQASRGEVGYEKNSDSVCNGAGFFQNLCIKSLNGDKVNYDLVIPGVLDKDEVCNLGVTYLGIAQIAARFSEKDGALNEFHRIWCEWLGRKDSDDEDMLMALEHEFSVVTFSYNYNLGRKGLLDDIKYLLPSSPYSETEEMQNRKRKSFSDPEDVNESLSNQYDSSGEESQSSNSLNTRLLVDGCDDQQLHSRVLKSKSLRRELRRQHRVAAERMCDLCQQKMLPGKDVAALLNRRTGRLVCSSRNLTGAFHVFHVSCLIHWILLCEMETYAKQLDEPKVKRKSRRKAGQKRNEVAKNDKPYVFCPECQGTGIDIGGDELEKPTVPLSEIFKYKIKATDAHKAWMKSPEMLQNCSIGFCFPPQSGTMHQENVTPLKLLHFYRAND